jgi:hypothetical protein
MRFHGSGVKVEGVQVEEGAHIHSSDSSSPSHTVAAVGSSAAEEGNTARKPLEPVVDEGLLVPSSLLHPCVSFWLVGD